MTPEQIAEQINSIYDGVEQSKVGKILENIAPTQQFPDGIKVNAIPFQTFLQLVNSYFRK